MMYVQQARTKDREMVERAILTALSRAMIFDPKLRLFMLNVDAMLQGDDIQKRVATVLLRIRAESHGDAPVNHGRIAISD